MGSRVRLIVIAELVAALIAVTTNIATNALPESWRPYLWLAWPLLAVLVAGGLVLAVFSYRADAAPPPGSTERTAYYRRALIARQRQVWIEGVLDRTLFRRTVLELGLAEQPDLLQRSWDVIVDVPDEQPRPLGRDGDLVNVVERHRSVLVLGAPGAGKTTMLLTLLRDLLDQAESDGIAPVPVVFRLESWTSSGGPLAEWFVDELSGPLYGLPRALARDWISDDRVLPLLDGLDEVSLQQRLACARAIEDFHRAHGLLPLVVTSRSTDYDALGLKLSLGSALMIQPLRPHQIEEYLSHLGEPLSGLREALRDRPSLSELLRTPFLLDVAVRAFHDLPAADVPADDSPDQWQAALFDAFVHRALRRRQTGRMFENEYVVRTLSLVARALGQQLESSFFLESVDADWLPARHRRVLTAATAIPATLLTGVAAGLVTALVLGPPAGIGSGVLATCVAAVFTVFPAEKSALPFSRSGDRVSAVRQAVRDVVVATTTSVVVLGVLLGVGGVLVGVVAGLVGDRPFGAVVGSCAYVGAVAGALLGLLGTAVFPPDEAPRGALRDRPIGAGLADVLWCWGFVTAVVGLPSVTVLGAIFGPPGLLAGLLVTLAVGYGQWGRGLLEHWATRVLLHRAGILPLRLLPFLDLAVDRALLLRAGGGHTFLHRLLLEHFAGLEPAGVPRSYLDSLPAVDLRPYVLLARAREDAVREGYGVVRLLAYTGSVLPPEVWAPAAIEIVESIEDRLDNSPDLANKRAARAIHVYNLAAIGQMILGAEHPELTPVAAIHLGELLVREPYPSNIEHGIWFQEMKPTVIELLESATGSGDPELAAAAEHTLARLRAIR